MCATANTRTTAEVEIHSDLRLHAALCRDLPHESFADPENLPSCARSLPRDTGVVDFDDGAVVVVRVQVVQIINALFPLSGARRSKQQRRPGVVVPGPVRTTAMDRYCRWVYRVGPLLSFQRPPRTAALAPLLSFPPVIRSAGAALPHPGGWPAAGGDADQVPAGPKAAYHPYHRRPGQESEWAAANPLIELVAEP
jgi:hypothetical protein